MIYFITTPSQTAMKIGYAKDSVERRIAHLQTAHWEELILIGWIPGSVRQEQKIHTALGAAHIRGEWVRFTPHTVAIAKAVQAGSADADSILAYLAETSTLEREVRVVANIAGRKRAARKRLQSESSGMREYAAETLVTLRRDSRTATTSRARALYAKLRARKVEAVSRRITS